MKERIRQLRKELGLSQTEFGEKIGVKQVTVAGYETGTRKPLDAVIKAICTEFGVNKEWLLEGTGPMRKPVEDKLSAYVSEITDDDDEFIKNFIEVYMELDSDSKAVIKSFAKKMAGKYK